MTLGERLKFIQRKSGLTLPIFGGKIRVSKESLINYQKDRTKPDSEILSTLCKIFKVNPAWLLLGEGEPFIQEGDETKTSEGGKTVPFTNDAMHLVEEAIQEAGESVTDTLKHHLVGIINEEMKLLARQVVRALKRGTVRDYNP
jgi:transcriptional regulator with XRE-family HTH domain